MMQKFLWITLAVTGLALIAPTQTQAQCQDRDWLYKVSEAGTPANTVTVRDIRTDIRQMIEFSALISGTDERTMLQGALGNLKCPEIFSYSEQHLAKGVLQTVARQALRTSMPEIDEEMAEYRTMIERKLRMRRFADQWLKPMVLVSETELNEIRDNMNEMFPQIRQQLSAAALQTLLIERGTTIKMTQKAEELARRYRDAYSIAPLEGDGPQGYQATFPNQRGEDEAVTYSTEALRKSFEQFLDFQALLQQGQGGGQAINDQVQQAKESEEYFEQFIQTHILESCLIQKGYEYQTYNEGRVTGQVQRYSDMMKEELIMSRYRTQIIQPKVTVTEGEVRQWKELISAEERAQCNQLGEEGCNNALEGMISQQKVAQEMMRIYERRAAEMQIDRNSRFFPS